MMYYKLGVVCVSMLIFSLYASPITADNKATPSSMNKDKMMVQDQKKMDQPKKMDQAKGGDVVVKFTDHPKFGKILTDNKGMVLYIFTDDADKVSKCKGDCAVKWPPLVIATGQPVLQNGAKGKLDVIVREDGKRQVTFNGKPLYFFVEDKKAGDTTGHEFRNKWFVIKHDDKDQKK